MPEHQQDGLDRRDVMKVLAAGAAASAIATPAAAQTAQIAAEAVPSDYERDATRWGNKDIAALFPGFKHVDMRVKGANIRLRHGGSGPPLLLLHGYPNTHVLWYSIAAKLVERYHVVCPDLRGYGDSSLPEPGANLINYSKRVMAEDMIDVMAQLGHQRFYLIGHDRGARVSHRMCLDHPDRVMKVALLDGLPTHHVWTTTTREWALGAWHWAFLAQPEPFPQTMINAVGAEWFLTSRGGIPKQRPKAVMDEFIRCMTPKTVNGMCRDYRANANIDFEHDKVDFGKTMLTTPLLVLWGTRGQPPTDEYPTVWKRYASNIVTIEPLPTAHYVHEELPQQSLDYFLKFFA